MLFVYNVDNVHVRIMYVCLYLYCVGDIKVAACITNPIWHIENICSTGLIMYMYNQLPPSICDRLVQHLAVATVVRN